MGDNFYHTHNFGSTGLGPWQTCAHAEKFIIEITGRSAELMDFSSNRTGTKNRLFSVRASMVHLLGIHGPPYAYNSDSIHYEF